MDAALHHGSLARRTTAPSSFRLRRSTGVLVAGGVQISVAKLAKVLTYLAPQFELICISHQRPSFMLNFDQAGQTERGVLRAS